MSSQLFQLIFSRSLLPGPLLGLSSSALAQQKQIECAAHNRPLPINNQAVLAWKASSRNEFKDRAHIEGLLLKNYADHSGHHHYQIQIGDLNTETVEVIYNESFGNIPQLQAGAKFEVCGDYITSNAPAGGYPASPDGAIIHWVHLSPNLKSHESGFVRINSEYYGLQNQR